MPDFKNDDGRDPLQVNEHVEPCSTCRFCLPVDPVKDPARTLPICMEAPPNTVIVGQNKEGQFQFYTYPTFTYGQGCGRHKIRLHIDLDIKIVGNMERRSPI